MKTFLKIFGIIVTAIFIVVTGTIIRIKISDADKIAILNSEVGAESADKTVLFVSAEIKIIDDFKENQAEDVPIVENEAVSVEIPNIATDMSFYTDYRFYNLAGSPSYRLQQKCYTDEYGCRRFGDDYVVGLGTYYSTDIGDRFEVTLDNGYVFTIILGDNKADIDTDPTNRYTECVNYDGQECANVIEFIVDTEKLAREARLYGSLTYYEHLDGNIVEMKYLGRDGSGDWSTYF